MAGKNKLSDKALQAAIRDAKVTGKPKKVSDGDGLVLDARPTGSGWWRLRFWIDGREGMLSLGTYPEVSLTDARRKRDEIKSGIAGGVDPSNQRKAEKRVETELAAVTRAVAHGLPIPGSFKATALEWHGKQVADWSPGHAGRMLRQLERDLFPWIGDRQMSEVEPMELLAVLQKVEARGAVETADRALMLARQVWEYWLPESNKAQRNITEGLKARLIPYRGTNFPAILDPKRFGELLRAMAAYKGGPVVRTALLLAPILFQRPGNLRMMEWAELDMEAGLWTIPSAKMKRLKHEKENGERVRPEGFHSYRTKKQHPQPAIERAFF